MMNLIINASEAIGKRSGYVAVTTALKQCDESFLHSCFLGEHLPPGRYVILQVEDTGCGMDDETRRAIFDPFFSTNVHRPRAGLSAVLGISRGHQGAISVEISPARAQVHDAFPGFEQAGHRRAGRRRKANGGAVAPS
jgi:signal transduction histidine kinase